MFKKIAIILLMCSVVWAVTEPAFEFNSDDAEFGFARTSIAYKGGTEYAANAVRTATRPIFTRPTITEVGTGWVSSYYLYAIDGSTLIAAVGNIYLKSTTPARLAVSEDDWDDLVDISGLTGYEASDVIKGVWVLADGSWLMSIGQQTAEKSGDIYRSTDDGANWTQVLTLDIGFTSPWGGIDHDDNEVVAFEYGESEDANNPRRVYYSDDYGATWEKIYEPSANVGQHGHSIQFAPDDTSTVYLAWGDNEFRKIEKITESGGTWSHDSDLVFWQPTGVTTWNGDIYWGADGNAYNSFYGVGPLISKQSDDIFSNVCNLPLNQNSVQYPYLSGDAVGNCFAFAAHDDVLYAAIRGIRSLGLHHSIYATVDGDNWSCVHRTENDTPDQIYHNIIGYADGYMWGTYVNGTDYRLYKMTPVTMTNKTFFNAEMAVTNQVDADTSSIESSIGNWQVAAGTQDVDTPTRTDEEAHSGSYSLKIQAKDNGEAVDRGILNSGYLATPPSTDDLVTLTFWIKAAETWPIDYGFYCNLEAATGEINGGSGGSQLVTITPIQQWQKVTITAKCTNGTWSTGGLRARLIIRGDVHGGADPNAVLYVDDVLVTYSTSLWYTGDYQVGGTARTAEAAILPLSGLDGSYSVGFEWTPETPSRALAADLPIATIQAQDNSYIYLFYDQSESKFAITDGSQTRTMATADTFELFDAVKFLITFNGTTASLYTESSKGGALSVTTGDTVNLGSVPAYIALSTNGDRSSYGSGLFSYIRAWDSDVNAESADIFDLTGDEKRTYGEYKFNRNRSRYDFTDVYDLIRR